MLLALTAALVLAWRDEGGPGWRLIAAAALLGLMGGSSWQLGLLAVPALAVVIWLAPRPLPVRDVGGALLTGGVRRGGLVARPVPGEAGTRAPDDIGALEAVADELVRPELRRDRYRTTWPNRLVNNSYLRLHLELAILHAAQGNLDDAERHLHVAASIDPDHELVQENLAILEEHRSRRAAGGG